MILLLVVGVWLRLESGIGERLLISNAMWWWWWWRWWCDGCTMKKRTRNVMMKATMEAARAEHSAVHNGCVCVCVCEYGRPFSYCLPATPVFFSRPWRRIEIIHHHQHYDDHKKANWLIASYFIQRHAAVEYENEAKVRWLPSSGHHQPPLSFHTNSLKNHESVDRTPNAGGRKRGKLSNLITSCASGRTETMFRSLCLDRVLLTSETPFHALVNVGGEKKKKKKWARK